MQETSAMRGRWAPGDAASLAAFAVAVALHLAWFLLPMRAPFESGDRARPGPRRALYLANPSLQDPAQAWHSDIRAALSPAIFSLPTPMGFSRAGLRDRLDLLPPARTTPLEAVLLSRTNLAGAELPDTLALGLDLVPAPPLLPAPAAIFPPRPAATGAMVRVFWLDAAVAEPARAWPVVRGSTWDDTKPWEITATLDFDGAGAVRFVMLEGRSGNAERSRRLEQELYRVERPLGLSGPQARVVVRGEPAPGEAKP